MKIQILSDLHFNHKDSDQKFPIVLAEYCIFCGDLQDQARLHQALFRLAKRYKKIFFVSGNHDYFGGSVQSLHNNLNKTCPENIEYLYPGKIICFQGYSILGCTLWFENERNDEIKKQLIPQLNDLKYIETNYDALVFEGLGHKKWLSQVVDQDSIVITHHAPSYRSINSNFQSQVSNSTKVNQCDEIIVQRRPKYWIHGHTHNPIQYMYADTKIVCNPLGFPGENNDYQPVVITL